MESRATSESCVGEGKKANKTRRSWSEHEEEVLIQALKDGTIEGWKSGNGFRPGYLAFLENRMKLTFPESNLRGNPHINLKVHAWKKMYGNLVTLLSKSGVGWNDNEKIIEASNETWDSVIKVDNNARSMRHKMWTYSYDWCEIFGNDCATGDKAENFAAAVQDVFQIPNNLPNVMGVSLEDIFAKLIVEAQEMEAPDESDDAIVAAINNSADITKETMTDLIKLLATDASDEKMSTAQDKVLEVMKNIHELSEDEKFIVAELLVDNPNKLSFFLRYGHVGRLSLARRALGGE